MNNLLRLEKEKMSTKSYFRKNKRLDLFQIILSIILFLMCFAFIYPLWYVLMASFSFPPAVDKMPYLIIPVSPTLDVYKLTFQYTTLWQGYLNSIIYLFTGTVLSITCTMLGSYALTRPLLYGKRVIMFLILLTMFVNGGMIPTFLVVKGLGLLNTRLAMILPAAISTWNIFIAKSYIQTNIPQELHDSAEVDGAGELKFFSSIVLPLSKSILAVLALFYGASIWNSYFSALIYLRDRSLYPLQLILREIIIQNDVMMEASDEFADLAIIRTGMKYSCTIVGVLPLLMIFPFIQRYFVKGVMVGSLKG